MTTPAISASVQSTVAQNASAAPVVNAGQNAAQAAAPSLVPHVFTSTFKKEDFQLKAKCGNKKDGVQVFTSMKLFPGVKLVYSEKKAEFAACNKTSKEWLKKDSLVAEMKPHLKVLCLDKIKTFKEAKVAKQVAKSGHKAEKQMQKTLAKLEASKKKDKQKLAQLQAKTDGLRVQADLLHAQIIAKDAAKNAALKR